jgi:hypothetical protein
LTGGADLKLRSTDSARRILVFAPIGRDMRQFAALCGIAIDRELLANVLWFLGCVVMVRSH